MRSDTGHELRQTCRAAQSEFYRNTAIATADTTEHQRIIAKSGFSGSIYLFTGICLAEAALTLLRGDETDAIRIGGGFLTPATLGRAYIDRLRNAGVQCEIVEGATQGQPSIIK